METLKQQINPPFLLGDQRNPPHCRLKVTSTSTQSKVRKERLIQDLDISKVFSDNEISEITCEEYRADNGDGDTTIWFPKQSGRVEMPVMGGDLLACMMYYGNVNFNNPNNRKKYLAFLGVATKVNTHVTIDGELIEVNTKPLIHLLDNPDKLISIASYNPLVRQATDASGQLIDKVIFPRWTIGDVILDIWKEIERVFPNHEEIFVSLIDHNNPSIPVWLQGGIGVDLLGSYRTGIDEELAALEIPEGHFEAAGTVREVLQAVVNFCTKATGTTIEFFVEPTQILGVCPSKHVGRLKRLFTQVDIGCWRGLITIRKGVPIDAVIGRTMSGFENMFRIYPVFGVNIIKGNLIDDYEAVSTAVVMRGKRKTYLFEDYLDATGNSDYGARLQAIDDDDNIIEDVTNGESSVVAPYNDNRLSSVPRQADELVAYLPRGGRTDLLVLRVENQTQMKHYGEKTIFIDATGIEEWDELRDQAKLALVLNSRRAVYGYAEFLESNSGRTHLWNSLCTVLDKRRNSVTSSLVGKITGQASSEIQILSSDLGVFRLYKRHYVYSIVRWYSSNGIITKISFSNTRRAKGISVFPSLRALVRKEVIKFMKEVTEIPHISIGTVFYDPTHPYLLLQNSVRVNVGQINVTAKITDTGSIGSEQDKPYGIFHYPRSGTKVILLRRGTDFFIVGRVKHDNDDGIMMRRGYNDWLLLHRHGGRIHLGDVLTEPHYARTSHSNLTIVGNTTMILVGDSYLPLSWMINHPWNDIESGEYGGLGFKYDRSRYRLPFRNRNDIENNSLLIAQEEGFRIFAQGAKGGEEGEAEIIASQGLNITIGDDYKEYAVTGGGIPPPKVVKGKLKITVKDATGTTTLTIDGSGVNVE